MPVANWPNLVYNVESWKSKLFTMKQAATKFSQEWLKILDKGMVTIPKRWRQDLGLEKGEVVRAQKVGNKVIIETQNMNAPYRIYTDREIETFLREDKMPQSLSKKISQKLRAIR